MARRRRHLVHVKLNLGELDAAIEALNARLAGEIETGVPFVHYESVRDRLVQARDEAQTTGEK